MKAGFDITVVRDNLDMIMYVRDLVNDGNEVVILSERSANFNTDYDWVEVQTGANIVKVDMAPRSKMYVAEEMDFNVYFTDNIDHREYLSKETRVNAILVV